MDDEKVVDNLHGDRGLLGVGNLPLVLVDERWVQLVDGDLT